MSVEPRLTPTDDASSIASWRAAATKAPAIGRRIRLLQCAWALLVGVGTIPTLAIIKFSLLHGYWPGLLNAALHVSALSIAFIGPSFVQWRAGPGEDVLPRRAARVQRFTTLRRVLMLEAAVLVALAPIRTLSSGATLQWGWPATLSVAMLLICWALERIFRAEWRAHQRLVAAEPSWE